MLAVWYVIRHWELRKKWLELEMKNRMYNLCDNGSVINVYTLIFLLVNKKISTLLPHIISDDLNIDIL